MILTEPIEWIPTRRRRVIRRSVRLPCEVVADVGFRFLGDRILDLSPDGLFLGTAGKRAFLGEEVFVSFRAPSARGFIDAVGEITRVIHGRRDRDDTPGLGIVFTHMSTRDHDRLREELRGLPPPVPARRPRPDYALTVRRIAVGR